jgi:hypothetical protein
MHFPKVFATAPFIVPTISTILLRWKYTFGKFKPFGCQLTVVGGQLSIRDGCTFQKVIADYGLRVAGCRFSTELPPSLRSREGPGVSLNGWQLSVGSCRLSVVGWQLSVVVGRCPSSVIYVVLYWPFANSTILFSIAAKPFDLEGDKLVVRPMAFRKYNSVPTISSGC